MNTRNQSPFPFSMRYGIGLGLIYIIYQIIKKLLNIHYINTGFNQQLLFVLFLGTIILAVYRFRKANNMQLTMRQTLQAALSVSIIVACVSILYTLLLTTVIEPDYYATYSEQNRERHIQGNPDRTPEQIEADIEEGLASLSGDIQKTFFFYIVGGAILSLPIGLIMRRKTNSSSSPNTNQ